MSAMTDLERFHACMAYQPADRAPFWAWGAWPETLERWKAEGYDPDKFDPAAAADKRHWFGQWFFPHPPFEHKVVAKDDQHVVYVNHEGILMKEMLNNPGSSMPQFLKFPVESRRQFRKFWSERMCRTSPGALGRTGSGSCDSGGPSPGLLSSSPTAGAGSSARCATWWAWRRCARCFTTTRASWKR